MSRTKSSYMVLPFFSCVVFFSFSNISFPSAVFWLVSFLRFGRFVSDNCLWPVLFLVSHFCGAPLYTPKQNGKGTIVLLRWCWHPQQATLCHILNNPTLNQKINKKKIKKYLDFFEAQNFLQIQYFIADCVSNCVVEFLLWLWKFKREKNEKLFDAWLCKKFFTHLSTDARNQITSQHLHDSVALDLFLRVNDAYQNAWQQSKKCSTNCSTTKYLRKEEKRRKKNSAVSQNCEQNNYIISKEKSLVTVQSKRGYVVTSMGQPFRTDVDLKIENVGVKT